MNATSAWSRDYFGDTSLNLKLDLPAVVPDLRVFAEWRRHLLRAVKEDCQNVPKHARATQVKFTLKIQ